MRRRIKDVDPAAGPPLPLTRYRGTTSREALAWMRARDEWWTASRDEDDSGWLLWLLEGWDQVGDLPWCGSVGAPCGDDDCTCAVWPEHLSQETDPIPTHPMRRGSIERNTR